MALRATRSRGARVAPPPVHRVDTPPAARTRRSTRQKQQVAVEKEVARLRVSSDSDEPSDTAQIAAQLDSDLPAGVATVKSKGLLAAVTPARRGAPIKGSPLSIAASISSRRPNLDDEDEDDDVDEDEEGDEQEKEDAEEEEEEEERDERPENGAASDLHQEPSIEDEAGEDSREIQNQVVDEAEQAKTLLKYDYLLKLASASNEILELLSAPDASSALFRAKLKVQKDSFFALRKIYEDSPDEPFAHWEWLKQPTSQAAVADSTAKPIIVVANIASAVEVIERALSEQMDLLPILKVLDRVFPELFTIPEHDDAEANDLALEIRTACWIETLIAGNSPSRRDEITAAIFCKHSGNAARTRADEWRELFARGPFRGIGSLGGQALVAACSKRINALLSKVPMTRSGSGSLDPKTILELRKAFPLRDLVTSLKKWLLRTYADSRGLSEQAEILLRSSHIHNPIAMSDSEEESQAASIIRMPTGERSVFHGRSDILQLYQDSQAPSQDDDEDDDDESAFETDPHFRSGSKRPATSSSSAATSPAAKRPRHRSVSSRERMPPPPLPRTINQNLNVLRPSPTAPPPPPRRDEDTSAAAAKRANAPRNPPSSTAYKTRQAWDHHDTETLIELIGELGKKGTLWAKIEHAHNHRFQWPRNEQAYRDKARNLKVDFLLADAPLPLNFDMVALHKKERKRIIDNGKNPWRSEQDVDERGRPINVDLSAAQRRDMDPSELY